MSELRAREPPPVASSRGRVLLRGRRQVLEGAHERPRPDRALADPADRVDRGVAKREEVGLRAVSRAQAAFLRLRRVPWLLHRWTSLAVSSVGVAAGQKNNNFPGLLSG